MADKTPAPEPEPTPEPEPEDAELKFWEKFDTHMEAWYEKKFGKPAPDPKAVKKDDGEPLGTSRTGAGRVTLSSLFADAIFGPDKK